MPYSVLNRIVESLGEQYKIKGSKGLHWAGPSAAVSFERLLYEKKQTIVSLVI